MPAKERTEDDQKKKKKAGRVTDWVYKRRRNRLNMGEGFMKRIFSPNLDEIWAQFVLYSFLRISGRRCAAYTVRRDRSAILWSAIDALSMPVVCGRTRKKTLD